MRDKFAHWNVLFVQYLKRDWKLLLAWIVGLGGFCGGYVPAFVEITKGQGLIGMYETMKNPAMIAMVGGTPVKEAADYTLGAMYSHMMLVFCGLFAMIAAVMHVVRHTRKEEEQGMTEFICTYSIGRHASTFALMVEELVIHTLMTVVIAVTMSAFKAETIDLAPSFLFGASIGLAGMMGAVLALLTAQIMVTAGGATGAALGIVGVLYIVRGATDVANPELSLFNPMGWIYLTHPFTENNWFLLLVGVIFCVAVAVLAFVLEKGRDMGAGYLPEFGGRRKVKKSLLSVHGILLRLNRNTMIGWITAFVVLGAAYGSIYGDMQSFLSGNEMMKAMFQMQGISIEASFTMTILVVLSGMAMILPVTVMNRLFAEEGAGRLGQIYATKTSRDRVYWVSVLIAVAAGVLSLLAVTGGLGGAALSVMEEQELELADFIRAGLNYFPAVLFVISLAGAALGWFPKWGKALYVYVVYSLLLNYFLNILNLPEWVEKTAILSWIPRMPVEEFDGVVFFGMTGISIVILVIGYVGYRKRDLMELV